MTYDTPFISIMPRLTFIKLWRFVSTDILRENLTNNVPQDNSSVALPDAMSLFRPPTVRSAGAILDRSLFSKTIPVAAARVAELKNISRYRAQLERTRELIRVERITNVQSDPDPALASKGGKCLLLKPEIIAEGKYRSFILSCRV